MNTSEKQLQAFNYFEKNMLKESDQLFTECLKEASSINEEASVRLNYGYVLVALEKTDQAVGNYKRMQQIGNELNNKELISQSYHQLGMTYRLSSELVHALNWFLKEKSYINNYFPNHDLFLAANCYELGYTYLLMKNYNKAQSYLNLSLKKALLCQDDIMIGCSYRALGEYYQSLCRNKKAKTCFTSSISYFRKVKDESAVKEVEKLLER